MLRLVYVVIVSIPFIIYYISKARFIEKYWGGYSEERRYRMFRRCVRIVMRNGRIRTKSSGQENLPAEGGYVMFPNHQGKYDTLGIVYSHQKTCTIVMDYGRSKLPIVDPLINLINGKRLDKSNMRAQLTTILQIADEVKDGRRYIIFPEGGYEHNKNDLQEFLPGAFKCATKAKAPIVPVALIDSYKAFNVNSLRKVTTQVHYLKPLYYDEYKEMSTIEIAEIVKERIARAIEAHLTA